MVSCIEIESVSLAFATLSLFSSCMGSFVCITQMFQTNILMAYYFSREERDVRNISNIEIYYSSYGLYNNVALAVILSFVVMSLIFSIILTKGLLSRKGHLVKAYYVYGVTANVISVLFALLGTLTYNMGVGLISLLGCFIYCVILIMIKSTYHKLTTANYDKICHKNVESEKPVT